tara:strand:- start:4704 stop:5045 length:342 start_codon:yes stop_codon:yes gene_type:complete
MANIYTNAKVDLTSTGETVLYTASVSSRAIVKSILVSNDAGSAATLTVTLTNAAGAVFSLFKVKSIDSNTTVQLLTEPLVLLESEILKVTASDANELHVVASLLEINRSDQNG